MITQKEVRDIFDYVDGVLIRKSGRQIDLGAAGYKTPQGYIKIKIKKKGHFAHRLIFIWHHGYYPQIIDHIDGNKENNRIENLRPATKSENCTNQKLRSTNKSGTKGVSWNAKLNKWKVAINKDYKSLYFGLYDDLELASLVAIEAANLYHKEFSAYKGVQNGIR